MTDQRSYWSKEKLVSESVTESAGAIVDEAVAEAYQHAEEIASVSPVPLNITDIQLWILRQAVDTLRPAIDRLAIETQGEQ